MGHRLRPAPRTWSRGRVAEAVRLVLDRAGEGDLVLLLGAQGMDRGRDVARDWLEGRAPDGRYIA